MAASAEVSLLELGVSSFNAALNADTPDETNALAAAWAPSPPVSSEVIPAFAACWIGLGSSLNASISSVAAFTPLETIEPRNASPASLPVTSATTALAVALPAASASAVLIPRSVNAVVAMLATSAPATGMTAETSAFSTSPPLSAVLTIVLPTTVATAPLPSPSADPIAVPTPGAKTLIATIARVAGSSTILSTVWTTG